MNWILEMILSIILIMGGWTLFIMYDSLTGSFGIVMFVGGWASFICQLADGLPNKGDKKNG